MAASLSLAATPIASARASLQTPARQRTALKSSGALSFSSSFSASLPCVGPTPCRTVPSASRPLVLAMAEKDKDKDKKPKKKIDSAVKRAKQAEVSRIYNKSRKTEISTRMKKVFKALDELKRAPSPTPEDLVPVEKLISEAYTIIDKSVKVGTIHKNKGAHRKSRLARAKRDLAIAMGWYTPPQAVAEPVAA